MIGNKLEPFKFWCQKVLPNVYDDSLSYYEYLCKLNEYLNEVIGQINTLTDNMEDYEADLTATWLETKEYIDNYFNNLDVQQEINNKLDAMAESGELSTLLAPIVGTQIGGVVADQIGATVANQIGSTVASQIDGVVAQQIAEPTASATTAWLTEHVDPVGSAVIVDDTLSISGAAADAESTGEAIEMVNAELSGVAISIESSKLKNFIDYYKLSKTKYSNQNVYTITGNSIVANISNGIDVSTTTPYLKLPVGTYTISTEYTTRIQVYANNSKIVDVNGTSYSFTLANESNIYIKLLDSTGTYPHTVGYVQIEKGNSATSFVPSDKPVYYSGIYDKLDNINSSIGETDIKSLVITNETTNSGTVSSGVIRFDGEIIDTGYRSELTVNENDLIYFSGYCYNQSFPCITLMKDSAIVTNYYKQTGYYYGNLIIPPNVNKIVVNSDDSPIVAVINSYGDIKPMKQYVDTNIKDYYNVLKGKKIVWYGTSIPAGGYIGSTTTRNYPSFIGAKYDATVYNESVGSSCAHCKELNLISETNPYGFNPNFNLSSRCLSNTIEEMQWIIDHFNDSFWTNKPASLTDQMKTEILSFSYENRLNKYLTENTFPDLFVFDHGYNDYISNTDNYTGHEYEPYTLQGALNFLYRVIYSYNPFAKIIMIGNYKYQTRNGLVAETQEIIAKRWDIPIFDNWHYTGLSDEQVYCEFEWQRINNVWTQVPTTKHLETLTNILLPDGIHPHSRPDNLIISRMANAIGEWLQTNVTFDS